MPAQPGLTYPTYNASTKIVMTGAWLDLYTLVKAADVANSLQAPGQAASKIRFFASAGNAAAIQLTRDVSKLAIETLLAEESMEDFGASGPMSASMAGWMVKGTAADSLVVAREF